MWCLKQATADGPSVPIAIQVEQYGDHVQVLKLFPPCLGSALNSYG